MINPDLNFTCHATNIVMSLAEDVLDKGRCIYVDNWYSSVVLIDELGKRSTDVVETVWKDRKALPKDVVNANLNKVETKTAYSRQHNAMCMQWKDRRDVHMLSWRKKFGFILSILVHSMLIYYIKGKVAN